ncbi:MAG: hypothetical protein G01um101416_23 [Microgenomates group bacterium Gr01-1014_16]|nr:MAG: hypothetical protein G01um101416_23 [Microgenomates group bacterium Gr01-1014_16]
MDVSLTHKFVAILNKKIPVGALMNALGHMAAGLAGSYPNLSEMRFDSYVDKDGNDHKNISDNPFIILQADNFNQIRTLRQQLVEKAIHFVDFSNTMTTGTYLEQQERTRNTPEDQLEYYGICMFGEKETINQLTKKFSLWR